MYNKMLKFIYERLSMKNKQEAIKLKRLAMDIPIEIHNEVKAVAALRGCSITAYIMRLIVEALVKESTYK